MGHCCTSHVGWVAVSDLRTGGCDLTRLRRMEPGLDLQSLRSGPWQPSDRLVFHREPLGFLGCWVAVALLPWRRLVGTWSPEDLFIPHPVEGIVEVAWLDPYASCFFRLGFNLSAIKPINIACFMCQPFLLCLADCRWFVITNNVDQASPPWWEGRESRVSRGVVWDIQIVFDAFIVVILELGANRGIRCSAGRGA